MFEKKVMKATTQLDNPRKYLEVMKMRLHKRKLNNTAVAHDGRIYVTVGSEVPVKPHQSVFSRSS